MGESWRTWEEPVQTLVGDSAHHWTTGPNIPPIQHDTTPHLHCHNHQLSNDNQDQWHVAKVNSENLSEFSCDAKQAVLTWSCQSVCHFQDLHSHSWFFPQDLTRMDFLDKLKQFWKRLHLPWQASALPVKWQRRRKHNCDFVAWNWHLKCGFISCLKVPGNVLF